jgi:hypothetical protein
MSSLPELIYPTTNPFQPYSSGINSTWWFFETHKIIPHKIYDHREHTDELIPYVLSQGGQIIERSERVPYKEKKQTDEDFSSMYLGGPDESDSLLIWYKGCLMSIDGDTDQHSYTISYAPGHKPDVREFARFLRPLAKASVSILLEREGGVLYAKELDFAPPVIEDLDLNYGSGFSRTHTQMVEKLNRCTAGLLLLHGIPGSGKSFYIKYLTSVVDREFIFVPVSLVNSLSSPSFIKLLLDHKHAVLILEDAEQALQSREEDFYNSSTVSTLLNLSDGLLGNLLSVSVIATFNAQKSTVDKALLRKGRLLFDHEFSKLNLDDANRLAARLGKEPSFKEPTILADIYNATEDTGYKEVVKKAIGFGFTAPTTHK